MSIYTIPYETALTALADGDELVVYDTSTGAIKKVDMSVVREFSHSGVVDETTATLTVTAAAHAGRTITLNRAGGITVTLPAASGTGNVYTFLVGTTFTSDGVVQVANASDAMIGYAIFGTDGTSIEMFGADSGDDTITLNGSTTGGLVGGKIKITDSATNVFFAEVIGESTGAEATPFSAAVS